MEFDQLRGFYLVAKLGSFTEAASKLYLTQPAISLQVKGLEREFGERLFERAGRRISLTPAGEILFVLAEEIVGKLDEIRSVMGELSALERGRFVLGTSDTTTLYFIPDLIKEFRRAHPRIEMHIENRVSQEVVRRVVDCEVDLGIVSLPVEERRLAVVPLLRHPLACLVASDHPLAERKLVRPQDLEGHPMVQLERGSTTRRRIDAYLTHYGVSPLTVIELSSFEIIKKLVAIGLGIAIIPEGAARNAGDAIHVLRFAKGPPHIELGAVYRRDRSLPHPARAFLKMAEDHFKNGHAG
jgi:LysR family hydrogen peroxide-inducible transcriptional activator